MNGIDVSWWQAKNKKTTALNWEKIHDAGIDFAFVRVASRDTSDGSIYEDTAANSHIQAALENDINVGLYIFSQALTEKEAKQEAEYVLDLADKYGWDVTLPIVIDREKGSHNRLTGGKLSKAKETAVCQAFADTITKAGYQAAVYASYGWIKHISIRIHWKIVASGLRVIIIRLRVMPRAGNLMRMPPMIMNSGSIHLWQR